MSQSSLSSVVSNLVRAQMGTSVGNTVTDDDLDRHVAELILREAKQKAERYGKDGIRAYLPSGFSESNVPKPNKRFLSSIIRSTDDHNKTILRAQAIAAQEVRMEREEQERRERRARAEEAVEAERLRRLIGSGSRTGWAHNWDRGDGRGRKRRERSWERMDGREEEDNRRVERYEREYRRRSKSKERRSRKEGLSPSRRSRSRHKDDEDDSSDRRRHRRDRERSDSPVRSRDRSLERDNDSRRRRHRPRKDRATSRTPANSREHSMERDDDVHRTRRRRNSADRHGRHRSTRPHSIQNRSESSYHDNPLDLSRRKITDPPPVSGYSDGPDSRKDAEDVTGDGLSREELLRSQLRRKGKAKASREVEPSSSQRPSRSRRSSASPDAERSPPTPSARRAASKDVTHPSHTFILSASRSRSPPPPVSSPPPLPPPSVPSKMDKYFDSSYDPRLDVAPLTVPQVPATGLIDDAEFAGWDAMLEIIRQRREDKAEKKILERWGISKDKNKNKNKGDDGLASRWSEGGTNIMDIEYKKRGSVREWDLGKEGF